MTESEPWEVLRTRTPPDERHYCKLPRFRTRLKLGLKVGALAKCKECGRVWEWTATSYDTFRSWCPASLVPIGDGHHDESVTRDGDQASNSLDVAERGAQ